MYEIQWSDLIVYSSFYATFIFSLSQSLIIILILISTFYFYYKNLYFLEINAEKIVMKNELLKIFTKKSVHLIGQNFNMWQQSFISGIGSIFSNFNKNCMESLF